MNTTKPARYIQITDVYSKNNVLFAKIDYSENISRYFTSKQFTAEYSSNIEDIDVSILSIPPLAAVITIAWATGADIYLKSVDNGYLDSLNGFKRIFKKWFPHFLFTTKINVNEIKTNNSNNNKHALLFSGGLDSLSSYIRNKEDNPSLICIWGADIPLHEHDFWGKIKNQLTYFADNEGVPATFIKTNARELIDDESIAKDYGNIKGGWWETVSHGLILTSLAAPLNFKVVLIAATFNNKYKRPHGSHIFNLIDFSWSKTKIKYDSSDLTRQEKIRYVLKNNPQYITHLRVCHQQFKDYNCGTCEKCLRTITGLILEGINPKDCKFKVKKNILDLIKNYLKYNLLNLEHNYILYWQDIQNHILNEENTLYNSSEFFEWFKNFDFSSYNYQNCKLSSFLKLYYLAKYKGISYTAKRAFPYLAARAKILKM